MFGFGHDRRTNAFLVAMNAAGVRPTSVQQFAVAELVEGLSQIGWSKFHAVYPFIGGTAATHAINLINPATYGITWNGTVIHNTNGATGNAASGHANTGIPLSSIDAVSHAFYIYASGMATAGNVTAMGAGAAASNEICALTYFNTFPDPDRRGFLSGSYTTGSYPFIASSLITSGGLSGSRTSSTSASIFQNGTAVNTYSGSITPSYSGTRNIFLMAYNNNNSSATDFANSTFKITSISGGLTNDEMLYHHNYSERFQTVLGRA